MVVIFDNIPVPANIAGRDLTNPALVVDSCLAALTRVNTELYWGGAAETETYHAEEHELSYRKQIARKLRTQFFEGISVTLKSTLRVTQGHWKRNHRTDHTRLTVRRVIGR